MKTTIIDGSFRDYADDVAIGVISIDEPYTNAALDIANRFIGYEKSVVLDPVSEGE